MPKYEWNTYRVQMLANDILIDVGIQAGEKLISAALGALRKTDYWESDTFSPRLEKYREKLESLDPMDAREMLSYITGAVNLAYRYGRKQKLKARKEANSLLKPNP